MNKYAYVNYNRLLKILQWQRNVHYAKLFTKAICVPICSYIYEFLNINACAFCKFKVISTVHGMGFKKKLMHQFLNSGQILVMLIILKKKKKNKGY